MVKFSLQHLILNQKLYTFYHIISNPSLISYYACVEMCDQNQLHHLQLTDLLQGAVSGACQG